MREDFYRCPECRRVFSLQVGEDPRCWGCGAIAENGVPSEFPLSGSEIRQTKLPSEQVLRLADIRTLLEVCEGRRKCELLAERENLADAVGHPPISEAKRAWLRDLRQRWIDERYPTTEPPR